MSRLSPSHICPEFENRIKYIVSSTLSISASSQTIPGAEPPSSMRAGIHFSKAFRARPFPTFVLPVNVIPSIS